MKRVLSILLIAVLAISAAACGAKTPAEETTDASATQAETTTDPAVTEPEVGRIGEKGTFYVYIPENWCKMEYTGDSTRLRLFDIPSAPKIEEGKTAEVEITVAADAGTKADVDSAVAALLKMEGAKKGKDTKLDGETFNVVTYTDAKEERVYTSYVGLGGGSLATVTLKGIQPTDADAAAILRSISFKSMEARTATTTTTKTTKPSSTAATTKKAANTDAKTTAAAVTTKAAEKKTTAAATKAAEKTTAATTKSAEKTTAAAKTTTAAPKTTKAAE